jgi:hypothetical protein
LSVEARGKATLLISARSPTPLVLTGVSASKARELLACFDGERTLGEVRVRRPAERKELEQLIAQTFGLLLFAPLALHALERRVSGVEISRFPGSPYEVARPYWSNMASIREQLDGLEAHLTDTRRFVAKLEELHVVALMGADLQTFYRPRSPIGQRRAAPGQLMHTPSRWLRGTDEALLLAGARVNASFIGGRTYHELLYATLEEPGAAASREHVDAEGLGWGSVLYGRSEAETQAQDWFCPPRPFEPAHFDTLRTALVHALDAAERRDSALAIERLASFHQAFVRLHPFHCGNQCLVMSIVNWLLQRVSGAGVPHLMLDHLALRLSGAAYARVFARAVAAYAKPEPDVARRYLGLAQKRARAFALLHEISALGSLHEARGHIEAAGDDAGLLLLRPLASEPRPRGNRD